MLFTFTIFGLFIFALEVVASQRVRAANAQGGVPQDWRKLFRWRFLVGTLLAVTSVFAQYPMHEAAGTYKAFGFPFFVIVFDEVGRGYTGALLVPALLGNGVIWFFLPSLFLWAWSWHGRRVSGNEHA
ncbi:MAG: hypothetical protein IPP88_03675 [Betaproteobacteria bacterium]|nr:hypothetical protein [Betaproteobacteria bacterium]